MQKNAMCTQHVHLACCVFLTCEQAAWPRDLLEAVMSVIAQAERAMPSSAQLLMSANLYLYSTMT